MSPKEDAENWRTAIRFGKWLKANPWLILVLGYSLGGGSSTMMDKLRPLTKDPRVDTLLVLQRETRSALGALQDTVSHNTERIAKIEDRDARVAYLGPRKRSLGRGWERD